MVWTRTPFAILWVAGLVSSSYSQERPVWSYKCVNGACEKVAAQDSGTAQGLGVCKALCGADAALWPKPTGATELRRSLLPITAARVNVTLDPVAQDSRVTHLIDKAAARFLSQLRVLEERAAVPPERSGVAVQVSVALQDQQLTRFQLDTDESYEITIGPVDSDGKLLAVSITAPNFFGARHALETLSQLAVVDDVNHSLLMFAEGQVKDAPAFQYRALNLDTSRNYLSVESIKKAIEGMAMNKLNTFHWHITDSHSWPFVSDSFPQLSRYGAYSQKQVYTPNDIRDIVEYARVRGVRVVPEVDAPAHVGEGFQWTDPGTIVCFKAQPWSQYCVEPPCGQLNPTREQVYTILSGVYADMLRIFDSDVFHMGGDEVSIKCWNSSKEVTDGMAELGFNTTHEGFIQLWDHFQTKALSKLVEANGGKKLPVILWTSGLTEGGNLEKYLDKDTYIIEIWTKGNDPHVAELVNKGYRVIFSNYEALYLDCGFAGWVTDGTNWCAPYIGWQKVYDNSPVGLLRALNVSAAEATRLTLGAEASLWTEQADDASLENRLWPRVAAMAERLWANPEHGWKQAESRMLHQRQRMRDRGFYPNRLQPQWCYQNEGHCPIA